MELLMLSFFNQRTKCRPAVFTARCVEAMKSQHPVTPAENGWRVSVFWVERARFQDPFFATVVGILHRLDGYVAERKKFIDLVTRDRGTRFMARDCFRSTRDSSCQLFEL